MESPEDLQVPDESRPAKRARLDGSLANTADTQEELVDDDDDWDDVYGTNDSDGDEQGQQSGDTILDRSLVQTALHTNGEPPSAPLPSTSVGDLGTSELKQKMHSMKEAPSPSSTSKSNDFVAPQTPIESTDQPSAKVLEESTKIVHSEASDAGDETHPSDVQPSAEQNLDQTAQSPLFNGHNAEDLQEHDSAPKLPVDSISRQDKTKATEDPQFLAAAEAQKSNPSAEWQFDPSDAETSSTSDGSDSDEDSDESESDSEGGYEMLDPATAAKILMSGDGDDDDDKGKGKAGVDYQPRTANEVKDTVISKPDVLITPDMKTTFLGTVERIVESLVLIKGATPGEYQVLESGSVLCNENREVIGAVGETLGRVQAPMYSVAFNNEEEIQEAALDPGTKIFYVDSHSTFVFTQPLRNLKGTDASNIHDEEVGEDEIEFSDDEKEAEYKRQKKLAKKAGREAPSRSSFNKDDAASQTGKSNYQTGRTHHLSSDVPTQSYGGGMSYDDDEPVEEFYSPLKRPDNLSQLLAGGAPPPRMQHSSFGRGRGRGRGDRGRGRGDRSKRRGGFDHDRQHSDSKHTGQYGTGHRGKARGFSDRNNNYPSDPRPHHPSEPGPSQQPPIQPAQSTARFPPPTQYQPQAYQFNGYTFQYGNAPPPAAASSPSYHNPYPPQLPHSPTAQIPAGAYVNPAFFQQHTQQQGSGAWSGQQQQHHSQPGYANAPTYGGPTSSAPPPVDLTEILKRLEGRPTQ